MSVTAQTPAVKETLALDATEPMNQWIAALKIIEKQMQRVEFITWFKDTVIVGRDHGTLLIGLPIPMALDWHMERYRTMTLAVVQSLDDTVETIVYNVDGNLKDNPERTVDLLAIFPEKKRRKLPNRAEVKLAEGVVSKIFNPRYTLESYVIGANNRLAHAACMAVSAEPGGKYNPLFIYGGVGLGKTHLLQATGNAILKRNPNAAIVYTTAEDFTNDVVEALQKRKMEQFRRKYRAIDVLMIDDIQFIANKDRTQEEFFHTFNVLFETQKQVIIAADRPPEELQVQDRLRSRFEKGMITDVKFPDYETRLAILSQKAKEYELFIDLSVLQFIAEHTTRSVRELEGILMQAVAQYELEQRMPTVKSIAEIMTKLNKDPYAKDDPVGFVAAPKKRVTFQDVLNAISEYYSISIQDMVGNRRTREILLPRQIAMYIGRKHLKISYVRLGELFSHRDHTTVMSAVKKIEGAVIKDAQLLREVRSLERELELG